jgi:hypothetical protein
MTFVSNQILAASDLNDAFAEKWTLWTGTQTQYDALSSYDAGTLYVVI